MKRLDFLKRLLVISAELEKTFLDDPSKPLYKK
jgi:hypothetical protein